MQHLIIATARGYLGTRFHHQGRLGKAGKSRGGLDCLGLLVCVARDLDLRGKNGERLCEFDARDYPHMPDTEALRARLDALLYEVPDASYQAADIVLLNIDGSPQHLGIIASDTCHPAPGTFTLIHAFAPARAVVEHALDAYWKQKIAAIYRLPSTINQ